MMLPGEVSLDGKLTAKLAFGFLWRYLICMLPTLPFAWLAEQEVNSTAKLVLLIGEFSWIFIGAFFATRWLYSSFGPLKVVFMESDGYEKLVKEHSESGRGI